MSAETIAQAIWEYSTRTLASGTPGEPSTPSEAIAEAVWEYGTRTLTGTLTLVSPTSGQTDVGIFLPLRLDWSDLSGAVSYQVQVSVNSDFSSPVIDTTTSNSYYETEDLLPGTKYYWRVRALVSN